jgi:hypothetical protein
LTESIGNLIPTQVPSLSEVADIQEAFRVYHYGATTGTGPGQYDPTNSNPNNLVNPSIAFTLNKIQSDVQTLSGALDIQSSLWTTKGAILTATAPGTVQILPVGANGQILTANSSTGTGLEWAAPSVSPSNTVTLTNKTINLSNNTITGTIAQFNTALSGASFTTLAGTETLTNKTINSSTIGSSTVFSSNTFTISIPSVPANSTMLTNNNLQDAYLNVDQTQKTSSYTLALTDHTSFIQMASSSALTVTVPTNLSVAFPIGSTITIVQMGTGQVTVAGASGVTVLGTPGNKLRAIYSAASLLKINTNTWILAGDLVA